MRPIDRGPRPPEADAWSSYGDARWDLARRLGWYCSYCETPINGGIHVEHILPKRDHPSLELEWENFLLACSACNSRKGDWTYPLHQYVWPHRDNTSRGFAYRDYGMVEVAEDISEDQALMADATRQMVGLDEYPDDLGEPTSDLRWAVRGTAWSLATRFRERLEQHDDPEARDLVVDVARTSGHWSVWLAVFEADHDMRSRLISGFSGTAIDCFGPDTECVERPGGAL